MVHRYSRHNWQINGLASETCELWAVGEINRVFEQVVGWLRQALIIVHILSLFLTSSANAHGSTCKVPIKFRTGVVRTPLCCCGSCALAKEGEEEFNIHQGGNKDNSTRIVKIITFRTSPYSLSVSLHLDLAEQPDH